MVKKLIRFFLQTKQLGETVRDLGLAGEQAKKVHERWWPIIIWPF
jgi:hypothetical protein